MSGKKFSKNMPQKPFEYLNEKTKQISRYLLFLGILAMKLEATFASLFRSIYSVNRVGSYIYVYKKFHAIYFLAIILLL